jgi:hypothetical protein
VLVQSAGPLNDDEMVNVTDESDDIDALLQHAQLIKTSHWQTTTSLLSIHTCGKAHLTRKFICTLQSQTRLNRILSYSLAGLRGELYHVWAE